MSGIKFSKSSRAGVLFPVSRVRRDLKAATDNKRVGDRASVYLAGVLQYLTELLHVAQQETIQMKRKRINPRAIMLGQRKDSEMSQLLKGVIIPAGGVVPMDLRQMSNHAPTNQNKKKKGNQNGSRK